MSIPAAKRRRTDAASYTLSKPFRSPMKKPPTAPTIKSPVPLLQDSSDPVQARGNDVTNHLEPAKSLLQRAATPLRTKAIKNPFSSPISSTTPNADPDIAALIKTQRQLENQLRELKEELDTAEQARRIEADSEKKNPGGAVDRELIQLILKWRAASRQAAEELFTDVRDRVNRYAGTRLPAWRQIQLRSFLLTLRRMGGPKVWKEMHERQRDFRYGWDTEPPPQPDSDDDDGRDAEKRDLYAEYDIDSETANEKEARGGNEILEDEGAEDVILSVLHQEIRLLTCHRSIQWP